MDADGGNFIRLTNTGTADSSPAWSPDGEWIAFTSWRDGNPEIYIMRSDGSDQQRLTNNNSHDDYPIWSPDGQYLLYTKGRTGSETLGLMRPDGSEARPLVSNNTPGVYPSWSPDGLYVYWSSIKSGIFYAGKQPKKCHFLSLMSIAFQSKNAENESVIYVAGLAGNIVAKISQPGENAFEPIWVP